MLVGILGGTGPAGKGVGYRCALAGHDVFLGSRDIERAEKSAEELSHSVLVGTISGARNEDVVGKADLIVLAVPWQGAVTTAEGFEPQLRGKVLVSMVNAIAFHGGRPEPLLPASGSIAVRLQSRLPEVRVIAAMHHLPARVMLDSSAVPDFDVLIAGDDDSAIKIVKELVNSVAGLRAVEAGQLQNATALEALTPVLIDINMRYKARSGVRITGLEL